MKLDLSGPKPYDVRYWEILDKGGWISSKSTLESLYSFVKLPNPRRWVNNGTYRIRITLYNGQQIFIKRLRQ